MKVEFRKATVEDIEAIISLCNECFLESTTVEYARASFEKTKEDPNQIYLVGMVDGETIAHAKITIIPTMFKEMNTYAILNHVCVRKDFRRHHIASLMLEEIDSICKEMGCVSIKLWSCNFRVPAHSCYQKYGFEKIDASFFERKI